jgi:hypothetical protein
MNLRSQVRKRLALLFAVTAVIVLLEIWVYHVLIGGGDPLVAVYWTVLVFVVTMFGAGAELWRKNRR